MAEPTPKLRACDVLNSDYLVKIAASAQGDSADLSQGWAVFAYDFTSTADEDERDTLLADVMKNATASQSKDMAEEVVARLAVVALRSDHQKLRQFGKENGVRLTTILRGVQRRSLTMRGLMPARIISLCGVIMAFFGFKSRQAPDVDQLLLSALNKCHRDFVARAGESSAPGK